MVMLKKVMSIGLVAFFGLGLVANVCSAAMSRKWEIWKKSLANQQSSGAVYKDDEKDLENQSRNKNNQSNNKKQTKDDDEDYAVNEEALQAEQDREDKDLEDMGKKAVWERMKK